MKDEIKELLQKIIAKVYELNQKSKYNIFVSFSGHVNTINVYYREKPYSFGVNSMYICSNQKVSKDTLIKVLERLENWRKDNVRKMAKNDKGHKERR